MWGKRTGLRRLLILACAAVAVATWAVPPVWAGGGPENVLLLIDPLSADSMYVGNYYKQARNIPDRNVLYLPAAPDGTNYAEFSETNLPVLLGMLNQRHVADHIDYVVIPPGGDYRLSASGFIFDFCSPVNNFSTSSLYTMAYLSDAILDSVSGTSSGMIQTTPNQYFSSDDTAIAFDNSLAWLSGEPSESDNARRYFIGAMLGYSGLRGNTIEETIAMIDRSVAVDGTQPLGTFYFMKTTDPLRSGPRDPFFPAVIASMQALGADAEQIDDWLPTGRHDALGILTGAANPDILTEDMTILDGAFCDHLTSWAADFDQSAQAKMSEWIIVGASGSAGTVEEPCNYPGKFPHPRMHLYYYQGLSLGEATLRSLEYVPYQVLLYGDPLTRPFAYLPVVSVPDAPIGPVSGTIILTPSATTDHPDAVVGSLDLLVDGVLVSSIADGDAFSLDTTLLADGFHDLRIVAYEDSDIASQGRWVSQIEVANQSTFTTLDVTPTSGDLATLFDINVSAGGAELLEIRLFQNGRVVAATNAGSDSFPLWGQALGGGTVRLVAEAEFTDGTRARSAPVTIDVNNTGNVDGGPRGGEPAIAFSYHLDVPFNEGIIVDLPGTDVFDPDLTWSVVDLPAQASVVGDGPTRLVFPDELAEGTDTLTFYVNQDSNQSNLGVVTLRYQACLPPLIETQPADQTVCIFATATFTVVSPDGAAYQWYHNDEVIDGATSATLVIEEVQVNDVGSYRADVASECGTWISSESATLTTDGQFPVIAPQPVDFVADCGGLAVFVSGATGDPLPAFQWQFNGLDIPGENGALLILPEVDAADEGEYQLVASNDCGSAISDPALLTVVGCADAPHIVSAGSVVTHGDLGELTIDLSLEGITSESRIGGGTIVVVVFDRDMDALIAENPENIDVVGVNEGPIDPVDMQAVLTDGTVLTITFPGLAGSALANQDVYTFDLSLLEAAGGGTIGEGGDADFDLRLLEGDASDDGAVDPLDSGAVLARFGGDVAELARFDINADGAIDPLDAGAVLARFGNSAP
ncbi:MAG: hypothetical protein IID37_14440 [Planctomycetes bacterium]|nr:hypothetical protein [Planctomycetota bacterium]